MISEKYKHKEIAVRYEIWLFQTNPTLNLLKIVSKCCQQTNLSAHIMFASLATQKRLVQ